MSKKHFSGLLLLTFVVAALVLIIPGKTGEESSPAQTFFLPGVAEQVNDIEWLRLTSGGGVTIATLKRERMAWVVEEASGYRVDWTRLKTLLSGLSQAEVVEEKTANPEYYPRLGVENVSMPDATGVMVEFSGDSGLPALIIGKSAQGRDGQYVRLRDSAESVLIDRRLDVSVERSEWLDSDVIDISNAEVVEVVITHPDGESIKVFKVSADDKNFQLQEIPEGQVKISDWNVNSLAGNLAMLSLDSVAPDGDFDWDDSIRFRLLTADGLLLEADVLAVESGKEAGFAEESVEGEYWIRLEAGLYTTAVESGVEVLDDTSGVGSRAETINNRVNGWAYRISRQKFDSMTKRKDDLLKPADSS